MTRIAPLFHCLLAVGLVILFSSPVHAQVSVESEHETLKLKKGRKAPEYQRWAAGESLTLRVEGPTVVELRLRPVFAERGGELELEAVRDGTHSSLKALTVKRAPVSFEDDGRIPKKDVKAHIDVGEGVHSYELIFSGEADEVLVFVKEARRAKTQLAFGPEQELPPPEPEEPPPPPEPPAEVAAVETETTETTETGEPTDEASELAVDAESAGDGSAEELGEHHGEDEAIAAPIAPPELPPDAPLPSVAVFQIIGKAGFEQDRCDMFSEFLQHDLRQRGHKVIGDSDIAAIIGLETAKTSLNCNDASCMAELGGALGVDEMVTGAIATLGPYLMITLKRIDASSASVVAQAAYKINDSVQGALADSILPISNELYGEVKADIAPVAAVEVEAGGGPGIVPITLWAVAGASLGAGVAFTMVASGHADNANNSAYVGRQAEIAATETAQTISFVGYGVAGAAAVAGTVLWLLGDQMGGSDSVAVAPSVHEQGAGFAAVVRF